MRLDQSQDFGPEILAPVGPAQTAARHHAEAQVHALDARTINKDLAKRTRERQLVQGARIQFEGQVRFDRAFVRALGEVGAQCRFDAIEEAADDTVFVQIADRFQCRFDLADQRLGARLVIAGIAITGWLSGESGQEQIHKVACYRRVIGQGLFHVRLAEGDARLAQIFAIGAQHQNFARAQASAQHQLVEPVIVDVAAPNFREGLVKGFPDRGRIDPRSILGAHGEVMHPNRLAGIGRVDVIGNFAKHFQAHVFQHGQDIGERHGRAGHENLEVQCAGLGFQWLIQIHCEFVFAKRLLDAGDIEDRCLRIEVILIVAWKRLGVAVQQTQALFLAAVGDKRFFQPVAPRPAGLDQPLFKGRDVHIGNLAARCLDDDMQARQGFISEMCGKSGNRAGVSIGDEALELVPQCRIEAVAGNEHKTRHEALERIASNE